MRNLCQVINDMIREIPVYNNEHIYNRLSWVLDDASYRAPEDNIGWDKVSSILKEYVPKDKNNVKDWEIKILSIFSTHPEEEIKKYFEEILK